MLKRNGDIDLSREPVLRIPLWATVTFLVSVVAITASVVGGAAALKGEVQSVAHSSAENGAELRQINQTLGKMAETDARQDERLKAIEGSIWRQPRSDVLDEEWFFGQT